MCSVSCPPASQIGCNDCKLKAYPGRRPGVRLRRACFGNLQPLFHSGDCRGPVEVGLPEYLEKVWEVVGREALEQVLGTAEAQARNGAAGALEEDSRLTALFLWTMQSTSEDGNGGSPDGDEGGDEEDTPRRRASGYSLPFDVTRRFAQPLGIHLDDWESRIIETKKGVVRLLPVTERGTQLFGESGAGAVADEMEAASNVNPQLSLFPEDAPPIRGRSRRRGRSSVSTDGNTELTLSATTLDRVHAAMLLASVGPEPGLAQPASGRTGARPRLPAPRQRPDRPLPPRQRGEAPAGCYAIGSAEVDSATMKLGG